jgi:hypothetical protein
MIRRWYWHLVWQWRYRRLFRREGMQAVRGDAARRNMWKDWSL